jgi:Holliday junction resolvase RusA-like endonuclease
MTAQELYITVDGIPRPQGSKRHVGNGIMIEASDVKPWREAIAKAVAQAQVAAGKEIQFSDPVVIWAIFYLPRPKSVKRPFPSVAPDLDKLCRSLGDGLSINSSALKDDALIIRWIASKRYADHRGPGAEVLIRTASHFGEAIPNALEGLEA